MPQSSSFPHLLLPQVSLHELILTNVKAHGEKIALFDSSNPSQSLTYDDIYRQAYALSTALHKLGIEKGDMVAVLLTNCIQFPVVHLGSWLRGAITSSANYMYTEYELTQYCNDCKPRVLFTTDQLLDKVLNVNKKLACKIQVIVVIRTEETKPLRKGVLSYNDLICIQPNYLLPPVEINPKTDLVCLPYSSGTTGLPKGVLLSHFSMAAGITLMNNRSFFLIPGQDETTLAYLPLYHTFGFYIVLYSLMNGCKIAVMNRFNLEHFLKTIQDYKVRHLTLVPPTLVLLAKDPRVADYDLSSLQSVNVGAATVGRQLSEELVARHPNIRYLMQLYGMTETGLITCMMPSQANKKLGSCGVLISNLESKIVDVVTGRELGTNQRGELCVRSPAIMLGYWKRPDATAEMIDAENWCHTGDIVYIDEDGFYFIVDRLKELIKVKGYQVAPAELEDVLLSHTQVQDAAVIGVPDADAGELPRAYVVLNRGSTLTPGDVYEFVHGKVSHYKSLKGGVEFVDCLPKSPSGKILRRLLKNQYLKACPPTQKSKM